MGYGEKISEEVQITWDPQKETQVHVVPHQHGTLEESILAGMKKVYKLPKWGMERRVAKRCRSRGTRKERANSMLSPSTRHAG
jgi:hypothetical protein